ncbi:MAG: arginine--tRNA ligase, partial [Halovenus sp.]
MFLAMRAEVEETLAATLDTLGYPADDLGIEQPPADIDAILASSAAFRLAGVADAPPPDVAAELAAAIDTDDCSYVGRVDSRGPYVNFFPADQYFGATLTAAQDTGYGRLGDRERSVVVEHTSANPTGPIHVGRARNPIIGDALARLLEYAGFDVERHYYVNDAGRQIAVFTWAYDTFDESDLPDPERDSPEYDLVRYYRKGTTYLEEADSEAAEDEIQAILQGLEDGDEDVYDRVSEVVDTVLSGMQETLARLPAEFDEFVKETRFIRNGATDDVVDRLTETEYAVYEEDAWQLDFPDIEKNLVFLRSDGTSLYTTRDIAHHEWKLDHFDEAVTILGEDHKLQAEQLKATLALLGHNTDRLSTVHYSWVTLPEGGMSTREGTGIDLDVLLDEAIERARTEVETRLDDRIRDDDLTDDDIERIARQVGIGAVRYDIVAKQPTKGITFEWERALDFEAQSAPYVQYVHARASGILDEAGVDAPGHHVEAVGEVVEGDRPIDPADVDSVDTAAERELLAEIARFPAVVDAAAADRRPHVVATYTRDIAEAFNTFYRECRVLDADPAVRDARLALVVAAKHA